MTGVLETLILFVVVIGGMFAGFFTPTEAAAIGAAGTILIALVKRLVALEGLHPLAPGNSADLVYGYDHRHRRRHLRPFPGRHPDPGQARGHLAALPLPGWSVMGLIILFYLLAGCFVDALGLILLTIPIFYPVVLELGYDPIWFGVIIVVVTQMGVRIPSGRRLCLRGQRDRAGCSAPDDLPWGPALPWRP